MVVVKAIQQEPSSLPTHTFNRGNNWTSSAVKNIFRVKIPSTWSRRDLSILDQGLFVVVPVGNRSN